MSKENIIVDEETLKQQYKRLQEKETDTLQNLKDFQRKTVEHIIALYTDTKEKHNRVLVADEVGLGKTVVARGVVAALAKHRIITEKDDLFKVVYICSNQSIARQNINKLNIFNVDSYAGADSRLSMQHLNIARQEIKSKEGKVPVQLIALTPDTSFRLSSGGGNVYERALMFAILRRLDCINGGSITLLRNLLKYGADIAWPKAEEYYENEVRNNGSESDNEYPQNILKEITEYNKQHKTIDDLLHYFEARRGKADYQKTKKELISNLRTMFATISLKMLQPDFVIMDEFQRFKFLLQERDIQSETGMLVNSLLSREDLRILLLSATPYKLYSTLDEIEETNMDEHYAEFLGVVGFLLDDKEKIHKFKEVWGAYSKALRDIKKGHTAIFGLKKEAEDNMYQGICRTERIAVMESGDYTEDDCTPLTISAEDIQSYINAGRLLKEIGASYSVPVDYIKSCPYIMSFMQNYELKKKIRRYFEENPDEIAIANKKYLWLSEGAINRYSELPPTNARLEKLKACAFVNKSELYLWVPPSRPYYEMSGVYKNSKGFSKTLVFSAWEMVPRMIACMLSYEAERLTIGKLKDRIRNVDANNTSYFSSSRWPSGHLNFSSSGNTANNMNLLTLLYPSPYLAKLYNPIECLNNKLSLKEIEHKIGRAIAEDVKQLQAKYQRDDSSREDNRWYYMLPILLDGDFAVNWLDSLLVEDGATGKEDSFSKHLRKLSNYIKLGSKLTLGKVPKDLVEVITNMTIGAPGVCIYRSNGHDGKRATELANEFRNRFNSSEATAIVDLAYERNRDDGAHWKDVLRYCRDGNFQAMFDEYVHVVMEEVRFSVAADRDVSVHNKMIEALDIRAATYNIDTFRKFKKSIEEDDNVRESKSKQLRSHFAVGFMQSEEKSEKDTNRKEKVRDAFNCPLRPFVLASTSIGQEGLDFHSYCRKIMHWNLPSNPIDLEQREGRINRYKCLAIRQDIAKKYGDTHIQCNLWNEMFQAAKQAQVKNMSELVPYWCIGKDQDVKIERIVPMYPFSSDQEKYDRLIKVLSLYRLTMGQARQENLLEYIFNEFDDSEIGELKKLFINLSPYFREH